MTDVETLVESLRTAAAADQPTAAVGDVLRELIAHPDALDALLGAPTERDELCGPSDTLYEADDLTIVVVHTKPGVVQPPHDHLMTAIIGQWAGCEQHRMWRRAADGLDPAPPVALEAGNVLTLGPAAVHAISADDEWARAVHVYLGNLGAAGRSLFHPETLAEEPLDMDRYVEFCVTA